MLIAGDIGGTKTDLAIYSRGSEDLDRTRHWLRSKSTPSRTGKTVGEREIHPLRWSLWIAESLLVVLGLDFADDFQARAAQPDPTITARVINYAAATPATIAKAEHQADRILGEAGLHVIWLDCPLG